MPAGSPIVIPRSGLSFILVMLFSALSTSLDPVQIHHISYIKDAAAAQQPGSPESAPHCLCQQEGRSSHCKYHGDQCRWPEHPIRAHKPDRDWNCALKDNCAGDIPDRQTIFLSIEPEKTVRHLWQLGRQRGDEEGED